MRIRFICCDVFARLAYKVAAESEHTVDVLLLPMLAHNEPSLLRNDLQNAIDSVPDDVFDMIILGYGLCGSSVSGLTSHIPMIIPRMHDCSAMFLGSREKFMEVFGHRLSTRWRSCGYMERCDDVQGDYKMHPDYLKLVDEYGEENAEYVWETMYPPAETEEVVYIELDGFEFGNTCHRYIEMMSKQDVTVEVVKGSVEWFKQLVNGPWDEKDFLEIVPGNEIHPIYDMDEVLAVRAVEHSHELLGGKCEKYESKCSDVFIKHL